MSHGEYPSEEVILAEPVETTGPFRPRPWGFWATLGLSLTVIGAQFAIGVAIGAIVVIQFMMAQSMKTPLPGADDLEELAASGLLMAVAEWCSASICLALVFLFVKLRKQLSIRDYLCLNRVSAKCLLTWTAILLIFLAAMEGTTWLLGYDVASNVMVKAYRTAVIVPLFWAAIVIAAPVFEEIFFRGFMFQGIQQSRLGNVGAVFITSLVWSMLHVQYDIYQVLMIFAGGILLGIARARSNSTYLTIALHSLWSVIAMLEMELYLRQC
jgi:membrane protease YdiL (CAAX protease family)